MGRKKSGFPQEQAETLARALAGMESQNVATKQNLEVTKFELKQDIEEIKKEIQAVKGELKRDLKELEQRLVFKLGGLLLTGLLAMVALPNLGHSHLKWKFLPPLNSHEDFGIGVNNFRLLLDSRLCTMELLIILNPRYEIGREDNPSKVFL